MDLIASRNIDGSIQLNIEFPATPVDQYVHYYVYRKEQVYASDTTGFLLTDGVINYSLASDLSYKDELNIKDGMVYYYTVYRENAGGKDFYQKDFCMGLVPNFLPVIKTMIPKSLTSKLNITDSTNPRLYTEVMLNLIQGEVEALTRNMPKMIDIDRADPVTLTHILKTFNWRPSPLLNIWENKQQARQLMSHYYPNKGQLNLSEDFMSLENKTPVRIWEWHRNQIADVSQGEFQIGFEELPIGVYSGSPLSVTLDLLPLPYSMKVIYRDGITDELISYIDTPEYDSNGDLTGDGDFFASDGSTVLGTIDYTTGDITFSSSPDSGTNPVFVQYNYNMDMSQIDDYFGLSTSITRRGNYGDKLIYSFNLFTKEDESHGLGATTYIYLNVDVGVEAYLYSESGV